MPERDPDTSYPDYSEPLARTGRCRLQALTMAGLFSLIFGTILGFLLAIGYHWFMSPTEDELKEQQRRQADIARLFPGVKPVADVVPEDELGPWWQWGLIRAAIGSAAGLLIGLARFAHTGKTDNLGTTIGLMLGIVPGVILFAAGVGGVRGKSSLFLVVGAAFAGSMFGMVLGGLADRFLERWLAGGQGITPRT